MFEPEIALTPIAESTYAFNSNDIAFTSTPLTPILQTSEPLSLYADPHVLQVSDVIAIDKPMLDAAIANATEIQNHYFNDEALDEQINAQKISHESFITFDLGLSANELDILDKIEIKKTDVYNRYGELSLLKTEVPDFLRTVTTADESQITSLTSMIDKLTTKAVSCLSGETAWFALRAYTPTDKYDIPRWHVDDHFTGVGSEHEVKFASALKGDQTLLYPASSEERTLFINNEDNRNRLNQLFSTSNAVSAKHGEGVIFIVGDPNTSAIHSEPKTDKNRLFLSVVAGSHTKIRELDARWNKT